MKRHYFYITAFVVVVLDQLTKFFIREKLSSPFNIASWLSIVNTSNTGAGFGILKDNNILLAIVALAVICAIIYYRKEFCKTKLLAVAGGLIIGGATGNLIDRLIFGKVTDFVAVGWWPVFNAADSAITVAAVLLICDYCQNSSIFSNFFR